MTLSWSAWDVGNFVSTMLLYPLPAFALLVLGVWVVRGGPATLPYGLAPSWFAAACAVAAWNAAALLGNRGNRITVDADAITARQGVVPWPVAWRRRRVPRAKLAAFDVDADWAPDTDTTVYKVRALGAHRPIVLTGALADQARARLIAGELARATGTKVA
ncbi:MAG: hypothetical protein H6709_14840 [Kofleriaceae bacterium]|nr:hypothetical protein [Kofleriaceae bacterium]